MQFRVVVLSLLGIAFLATAWAASAEKADSAAVCPVAGKPINKAVSTDYNGGKVYFCCKGCLGKFTADSDKYAAKANRQLVQTGQAKQVKCPITGKDMKSEHTLKVADVDVAFCCGGCPKKVAAADEAGQLEMVFGKAGFEKGFKMTQ
jgi:YHS domain-containing protein